MNKVLIVNANARMSGAVPSLARIVMALAATMMPA